MNAVVLPKVALPLVNCLTEALEPTMKPTKGPVVTNGELALG